LKMFIPKVRGMVFLSRPLLKFFTASALIKFDTESIHFDMDLNQEYELSIFLFNKHELAVPYVISKLSKDYNLDTFIDIGANVGWVSRIAAKFGALNYIYSFEPNDKAYSRLKECSGTSINPFKLVISDKSGDYFETHKVSPFSGSSSFYYKKSTSRESSSQIKNTTLNEFLSKKNTYANIIKIDVEGAELAVLKGGIGLALDNASFVIIEVGEEERLARSTGGTVEEIYSIMKNLGFTHFYNVISSNNSICKAKDGEIGDILFSKKHLDLSLFTTW
jgi:FkbM family methyltransferase